MLVASIAPYTEQRRITRFIYTTEEEEKLNSNKKRNDITSRWLLVVLPNILIQLECVGDSVDSTIFFPIPICFFFFYYRRIKKPTRVSPYLTAARDPIELYESRKKIWEELIECSFYFPPLLSKIVFFFFLERDLTSELKHLKKKRNEQWNCWNILVTLSHLLMIRRSRFWWVCCRRFIRPAASSSWLCRV